MVNVQGTGLDKLLGHDMPEIAYLKNTGISQVLSKGLAETFRVKPNDPKTYFAKFLLNYAKDRGTAKLVSCRFLTVTENLIRYLKIMLTFLSLFALSIVGRKTRQCL